MFLKGDVKAVGLTNESKTASILYVYNTNYTWANPNPTPAENVSITLKGLKRGDVQIDVWDTMTGEIIRSQTETVSLFGTVTIPFDSLAQDVAVMVQSCPSASGK